MSELTPQQRQNLRALADDGGAKQLHGVYAAHGAGLRFVGGCVRDALLGIAGGDIDLATDALPQDGMAWLQQVGVKVVPTGLAHGTLTAILDGRPYEITTLRRDIDTDGRHATVRFGTDWTEDARRRDFTINGLSCDFDGILFDPVGGLVDLLAGGVRFIGAPEMRCREDYLRILRLFRFWARFGRQPLDEVTLQAVRETVDGLPRLSAQRVWSECKKLLQTGRAADALIVMHENDVLSVLLENEFYKVEQVTALRTVEDALQISNTRTTALRRLATLLAYRTTQGWSLPVAFLQKRFALSNKETDELRDLQRIGQASDWWMSRLMAALATFDRSLVIDACLIAVALGHETQADLAKLLPDLLSVARPVCPVRAKDLLALGNYAPGPALGQVLARMNAAWLESNCTLLLEDCLQSLAS